MLRWFFSIRRRKVAPVDAAKLRALIVSHPLRRRPSDGGASLYKTHAHIWQWPVGSGQWVGGRAKVDTRA
jgi:hypothetical protein